MSPPPYAVLTPELVLDALDSVGIHGDGRLLALNSYENRVYQAWREDLPAVVVKFYRPGRWSDEAIDEEHAYVLELAALEIPVVAPMVLDGRTIQRHEGFRFAVYPKRGGRAPELDRPDTLERIGRFLGRIHAAGGRFEHRPPLDIDTFGFEPRRFLVEEGWVPVDLADAYASVSSQALDHVRWAFERAGAIAAQRLHGDCHGGNMLWTDDGPHFVDFDDARNGPTVQDLWMLLAGDRATMQAQLRKVLDGYELFHEFDRRELHVVEALRTLRLLHYSAWIAQRWEDPAFPAAFPWFNEQRYWQDRILELREQVALMDEPPLSVD